MKTFPTRETINMKLYAKVNPILFASVTGFEQFDVCVAFIVEVTFADILYTKETSIIFSQQF